MGLDLPNDFKSNKFKQAKTAMPLPSVAETDCTVLDGAGAGVDMHVLSSCPAMRDTGVVTSFQINLK